MPNAQHGGRAVSKEARQFYMARRSRQLAASGKHKDYLTIAAALVADGYPEARTYLGRESLRNTLKQICDQARGQRHDA